MLVIPAIDLMDGRCVRLHQGDYEKRTDYDLDPVERASAYQRAGFRRLHVVDLDAAKSGSGANREAIRRIVASVGVPVQTGGGIRAASDVEELLRSGVQFLILGTVALERPDLVASWVARYGPDRFIVSLDLRDGRPLSRGWTEDGGIDLGRAVQRVLDWGVPQIVCTDVERDGTLGDPGYDSCRTLLELLPAGYSLTAAGGVSRPEHLVRLEAIGVSGAVVGKALYEGAHAPEEFLRVG